jgi:hypothetical protein
MEADNKFQFELWPLASGTKGAAAGRVRGQHRMHVQLHSAQLGV